MRATVEALVRPIFAQGHTTVYAASCCGRLYVGVERPVRCADHPEAPLEVFTYRVGDFATT